MAYSKSESLRVLAESFPHCVQVKLREGTHQGKPQLFAWSGGHRFIVQDASVEALKPHAGQIWLMHPEYTPNGHVVFCAISTLEQEAEKRTELARKLGFDSPEHISWQRIHDRINELVNSEDIGPDDHWEFFKIVNRYRRD